MDQSEFQRRVEVYLDQELPDLPPEHVRIAEVVARRMWLLVDGWQAQMHGSGELLLWIAERLQADWPEAAARLAVEQSGSEVGFWPPRRRQSK